MTVHFCRCIWAEAVKQHKKTYHSGLMYFSMLLWPILQLLTTYYAYKPFAGTATTNSVAQWVGDDKVFAFIVFGYMGYAFFRCFVQSAWMFTFERTAGTLELVYLAPSSRLGIMLGNAASSLFECVWMFTVFCLSALLLFSEIHLAHPLMLPVAILFLLVPSVCWGVFLNSLFIFTRDSGMLFSVLEDPMELFGGAKLPFSVLPFWAKLFGGIFPLTWSVTAMRKIFMQGANLQGIKTELLMLLVICSALSLLTGFLLIKGESYAKKTGNMALF